MEAPNWPSPVRERERLMILQDVILKAISGTILWVEAAEILPPLLVKSKSAADRTVVETQDNDTAPAGRPFPSAQKMDACGTNRYSDVSPWPSVSEPYQNAI
jgi:hypothetical protein